MSHSFHQGGHGSLTGLLATATTRGQSEKDTSMKINPLHHINMCTYTNSYSYIIAVEKHC